MLNYWTIFSLTGDLDAYLLHKKYDCDYDDETLDPEEEAISLIDRE